MSRIERFVEYAAAFEKAYASDDWSVLEPLLTDDVVYEVPIDPPIGGRFEGKQTLLAYFQDIVNRFDRRFDSRKVALDEGPREDGDSVWIRGRAIYDAEGVPQFVLELEETVTFVGDRVSRIEDFYSPEMKQKVARYLADYGEKLGIG